MQDVTAFSRLFCQEDTSLGRQIRRNRQGVAGQRPERLRHEVPERHAAARRIQHKNGMGKIQDAIRQDACIISRRLHPVWRMLMGTEVSVGPVEIGIEHLPETCFAIDFDPAGSRIHHKRSLHKLRRKRFRRRKCKMHEGSSHSNSATGKNPLNFGKRVYHL